MSDKNLERVYWTPADDWFDEAFICNFLGEDDFLPHKKSLNEKKGRISSDNFSYRIINYWQELGLIEDDRNDSKGWRRYSFTDMVWLHIISELRKFGFPVEKIKRVKEDLSLFTDEAHISKFPLLDFFILFALNDKKPVYVIVCENGQSFIMTNRELGFTEALGGISNYISINLNKILQKLVSKDIKPNYFSNVELRSEEIDLIHALRFDQIESISVRLQDGKIATIEKTFVEENRKRIVDLLKSKDFQDIDIKVREGKVVRIQRKEIIKPPKGDKSKLTQ